MWRITRLLNFLLCFTTLAYGADNNRGDRTDVIIKNIMSNYDKSVHPNSDRADGAVQVEISLKPLALNIDEESATLTSHIWLALAWTDKRLTWDKRQNNISKVHIGPDRLWKPDIRLYNSIIHEDYEATDVLVYNDGQLFWVPPVTTHTTCNLDYRYWPWDIQVCNLIIGSWTKSGWEIDVVNMDKQNISDIHLDNYFYTLWEIMDATSTREVESYEDFDAPYPAIRVDFTLRRVSWIDRKLAVFPLILVSCLTLAAFWTHPSSGNRIRLGCLNFFVVIFLLIQIRQRFPIAGAQLPLVVSFAGSLGVLVTIQLLVALSMANLISRRDSPPSFLIWPLQGSLGSFLCLSDLPLVGQIPGMTGYSIDVEALRASQEQSQDPTKTSAASQATATGTTGPSSTAIKDEPSNSSCTLGKFSGWNLLCQAIDRILFISYLAIIFIFIASYLGGAASATSKARQ